MFLKIQKNTTSSSSRGTKRSQTISEVSFFYLVTSSSACSFFTSAYREVTVGKVLDTIFARGRQKQLELTLNHKHV